MVQVGDVGVVLQVAELHIVQVEVRVEVGSLKVRLGLQQIMEVPLREDLLPVVEHIAVEAVEEEEADIMAVPQVSVIKEAREDPVMRHLSAY